jgi:hypothetical protein
VCYQAHGHASSVEQAYRLEYRSKDRSKARINGMVDRRTTREVKLVLNEIIFEEKVIDIAESVLI